MRLPGNRFWRTLYGNDGGVVGLYNTFLYSGDFSLCIYGYLE